MESIYLNEEVSKIFGIPFLKRKSKKEQIFEENYDKYYRVVYKQIYYMTGNNALAEDLTQEVFIKYYNNKEEIEFLGAWLSKVATNITLNNIRGENRRNNREEDDFLNQVEDVISVEDLVCRNEEVKRVRRVLTDMKEEQRTCLLLKFAGYSYDEISQITSIKKSSISQHISRGKERFKSLYERSDLDEVL